MNIEKTKLFLLGAVCGAFILFGFGFGAAGWIFGSTAAENTNQAVIARLTPICLDQFKRDPMSAQKTKAIEEVSYGMRGKFVAEQGWATMPGETKPDMAVAASCGDKIGN